MTDFVLERITRRELPKNTTQKVDTIIGDATGRVEIKTIECRLAGNFDEIVATTVSNRSFPNIYLSDAAQMHGTHKIKPLLRYFRSVLRSSKISSKSGLYLDTRHACPNNISHALNFFIPCALAAEALVGEKVQLLTRPVKLRRVIELFDLFDVQFDDRGVEVKGRTVELHVSRGFSLYNALTYFDMSPHTLFREIIGLGNRFSESAKENPSRKSIFISRKGDRELINARSIENLLERHGYETIFMEDYSIEDQCRIGAQAEKVVAIHGAGMAFLALNSRLKVLIEILPPNVYHQFFPTLLADVVEKYIQILPEINDSISIAGWDAIMRQKQKPFLLDEGLLRRALSFDAQA